MNDPVASRPVPAADAERERRLSELLERLLGEAAGGREPDWSAVAAAHPQLVDELRELYATAMVADDFGRLSDMIDAPTVTPRRSGAAGLAPDVSLGRIGDYELLDEIGRGGMGVVFKARQVSLGRIVALKMILRGELASGEDLARFRAEAEAAARLSHPHIVPVYEVGEWQGQPFFSMRYVEGTTLSKQLVEGPLSNRDAAELLVPICDAIAHAHAHGLLHRDLKPSNILIDKSGRPYVTDFGLAKQLPSPAAAQSPHSDDATRQASLTRSGAILGTPSYMAPEQAGGRRGEVGAAADIYSLGAILYAALTGRAPFQSASPVDTVLMVLEQDPLPPRLLNKGVEPDLEMIALKCLQKPIDLRYESVEGLRDDLAAVLRGEPPAARSSHFTQVLSRAFRETHHAGVLENWGLLWMWHSFVVLGLCATTNAFQLSGVTSRLPYMGLWILGLGVWAAIFWGLRRRSGPVTFVERQIAHVWAGAMGASTFLFWVEAALRLPVLSLSCVLALVSGAVFMVKAGILSGRFYLEAGLLYCTAVAMAYVQSYAARTGAPDLSILLYGVVIWACFFFPGLKYYRRGARGEGRGARQRAES
jgi:serine/threonine-protein kinase